MEIDTVCGMQVVPRRPPANPNMTVARITTIDV